VLELEPLLRPYERVRLADDLVGAPAVHLLGRVVPRADDAFRVDAEDRER
jgi:hypothetical protein